MANKREEMASFLRTTLWARVATSIVASIALVAITIRLVHPAYATIDDARLLYVYAGYASGQPEGTYLFSNAAWGGLVATLYSLAPAVDWYFLCQASSVVLASAVMGGMLLEFWAKSAVPLPFIAGLYLLLFGVMYQNAVMLMHFEVCAAMLGASGVALLLLSGWARHERGRTLCISLSAAVMILCYLQEKNTFYASFAFYLLSVFYLSMRIVFRSERGRRLRSGVMVACPVLVVALGMACFAAYNSRAMGSDWADYMEYNPYRIAFWDYPHDSYKDNPELYSSAGWSEDFYNATQCMYFMDERFDTEGLSQIVKPFDRASSTVDEPLLTAIPNTIYELFKTEVLARWQVLLGLATCLVAGVRYLLSRHVSRANLEALLCLGGALMSVVMCLYLAWRGRLPLRAWEVVSLPGLTTCLIATAELLLKPADCDPRCQRRAGILNVCSAIAVSLMAWVAVSDFSLYCSRLSTSLDYRMEYNANVAAIERYAMDHPDNLYITGQRIQNYNPFTNYPGDKPTNVVSWGSSYYRTPTYEAQMTSNDKPVLTSDNLLDSDVYLIVNLDASEEAETVFSMLKRDYGAERIRLVELINDDIAVCKIE